MLRWLVRLIAWLPLAALAFGVAAVVYLHVRYSPRCSIATQDPVLHVADDGEWLLTETSDAIRVWNARTGARKADYLTGMRSRGLSRDRELLLGVDKDTLHILDWRNDKSRTVIIGQPVDSLSLRAPWCVVTLSSGERLIIDLRDERIARRFPKGVAWQWRDDDRLLFQDGDSVHLWNLAETRVEATLPVGNEKLSEWFQPRSGRWVVTWTVKGHVVERFDVWDFKTKSKRVQCNYQVAFSADGERMAYLHQDRERQTLELVVLEADPGRQLWKRSVRQPPLDLVDFSSDSQLICLIGSTDAIGATVLEAETGKLIYEDSLQSWCLYRKNLLVPRDRPGAIRDAGTGKVLVQIPNAQWSFYSLQDEQYVVVGSDTAVTNQYSRWLAKLLPSVFGEGQLVQVYESGNLREVYRVRFPSQLLPDCWTISKDGTVFVTLFDDPADGEPCRIDVWEMNPRRAQVYAGLSGAAVILSVIAFRAWRRRHKVTTKG